MGRFKIYDAKKFVQILNDTNYAKCLMCEKKLKNIMGNIKRHYEQMHSICVDASDNKKKKSKKKASKYEDNDNDFKLDAKCKKSFEEKKQNTTTISLKVKKENPDIILKASAAETVNINSSSHKPPSSAPIQSEDTNKDYLFNDNCVNSPKGNLENNQPVSKVKHETDNLINIPTKAHIEPLQPLKKIKLSLHNNEQQNSTFNSHINNLNITSFDSGLGLFNCSIATKTQLSIPIKNLQEGYTFQKALQSTKLTTEIHFNSQTIGEHMDTLLAKMKREIIQIVSNRLVYLKLDIASTKESNIMLVNIQFIKDFEMKVLTLSVLELLDEHLATFLKEKVLKILECYQIDISRVYSITKDNANNVKESLSEKDNVNNHLEYSEYCQHLSEKFPGHGIHFVACDVIKKLNENISQSRDSVRSLRMKMSQHNMKEIPVLDNTSSWFSIYDMIKSLLNVRDKVENNSLLLIDVDWKFVLKFEQSFRPIVDTALMLQSNNNFIMGDLYREWLLCETELEELSISNELALYLLQTLRKRKLDLFENTSFLAALYLDPRFCYMGSMHLSDKQKDMAITQLLEIFNKLKTIPDIKNSSTSSLILNNDRYRILEKKLAQNMATTHKSKMETITINDATPLNNVDSEWLKETLEHLQFEERLPYNTNILDYWKITKYKNPILAKIAEIALAAPATQSTINRALNAWPIAEMKRKFNIISDNIENLLLLKLNQDLVDKISLVNNN